MPPLSFSYPLRRLLTRDRWRHLHVKAAVGAAIVTNASAPVGYERRDI